MEESIGTEQQARAIILAAQNDAFRLTGVGGQVTMTASMLELGSTIVKEITKAVRDFQDFNENNDPHGEHDFGVVEVSKGRKFYFKIDYYNDSYEHRSADPTNTKITNRVMTIAPVRDY